MLPKHIGFIMDGNGRWASTQGLARSKGYQQGVLALLKVAKRCQERGIEAISVYALSKENLLRPSDELQAIFNAVEEFNNSYKGDWRITYMGDFDDFPSSLVESIESVEDRTFENKGFTLNIAFNYGAKQDIIRAAKLCFDHAEFVEDCFESRLSTSHLPQLDLIVRSGGEMRLSNFLLYESAYAELIFLDKLWPDMNEDDVDNVLSQFESRHRRFGK